MDNDTARHPVVQVETVQHPPHGLFNALAHDHVVQTSFVASLAVTVPLMAVADFLLRIVTTVACTAITSLIVGAINRRWGPPPAPPTSLPPSQPPAPPPSNTPPPPAP